MMNGGRLSLGTDSRFYGLAKVLQVSGEPESNPRRNHCTRCAEVPWVNDSGLTRPDDMR